MAQSREQARLAERRRQERRAARQAESMQQRKTRSVIGAVVAILVLIGAVVAINLAKKNNKDDGTAAGSTTQSPSPLATDDPNAADPATPNGAPTEVACGATAPTAAGEPQKFTAEPAMSIDTKASYVATIKTSCGTLSVALDAAKAPHTVNSWNFLAGKKFWDGTRCHRMTEGGLSMLQCGDPTGTGSGDLGYTIAEENLTGATYPKGTIAMANTGQPHSSGDQFFIVFADSQLQPNYTVVGHVTPDTVSVLDKIAAVGTVPGGRDSVPAKAIYLDNVTVAKKA